MSGIDRNRRRVAQWMALLAIGLNGSLAVGAPVPNPNQSGRSAGVVAAGGESTRTHAEEDQVRAAFLFQLAQYVNWPAERSGPMRFCVLADEAMAASLREIGKGKKIRSRGITVAAVGTGAEMSAAGCELAFIGYAKEHELRKLFASWNYHQPVLLVGQAAEFAAWGGMVNLRIAGGRVSFEINLAAVQRARLEIRSQLLRFAKLVGEAAPPVGFDDGKASAQ